MNRNREVVRMRMDVAEKITALKAQVQSLLKRNQLRRPASLGRGWTKPFRGWLQREVCAPGEPGTPARCAVGPGGRAALASLLRQLESLEDEEPASATTSRKRRYTSGLGSAE